MLTMWVTEDEHRRLLERCDGKQLAAWMRQTCLDEKPARAGKLPSLSPALLRQLAGMGNNLNQIARQVNGGGGSGHDRVQTASAKVPAFCRGSRMKSGSLSTLRPTPKSTPPASCPLPNRTYRPASVKS